MVKNCTQNLNCYPNSRVLTFNGFRNMKKKNFGPCSIVNCTYKDGTFCLITELAYQKCHKENMLETYPYLEVGKQLCHIHYCKVVEPNRGNIQYK